MQSVMVKCQAKGRIKSRGNVRMYVCECVISRKRRFERAASQQPLCDKGRTLQPAAAIAYLHPPSATFVIFQQTQLRVFRWQTLTGEGYGSRGNA